MLAAGFRIQYIVEIVFIKQHLWGSNLYFCSVFLYQLCTEFLAVIEHMQETCTSDAIGSATGFRHLSSQTIYAILDYLKAWLRHRSRIVIKQSLVGRNTRIPTVGEISISI